jgi:hypothetical protein
MVELQRSNYLSAVQYFIDSFNVARVIHENISVCDLLASLAAVASGMNQPERAAKLYGAAQALFDTTDYRIQPFDQAEFDRHIQIAREQLSETQFEALVAEGRAMTLEQAIAEARESNG